MKTEQPPAHFLAPELEALADWFDRLQQPNISESIRDYMPERDGHWCMRAQQLIACVRASDLPKDLKYEAKRLLKSPRCRMADEIKQSPFYDLHAGSRANRSNSCITKSVGAV